MPELRSRPAVEPGVSSSETPYRNELETLEARRRVLASELESVEARISEKKRLPMLDQVRVASPCPAKWDEMVGDDRKRFCLSCDKHVFNLSALARAEAERFLAEQVGNEVCVRYYQRADGTIMTSDCAVGVTKKRRKKLALAVAGAGAMAFGAVTALTHRRDHVVMGALEAPMPVPVTVSEKPPVVDPGTWIAGTATATPPPVPPAPPRETLGRMPAHRPVQK